MGPSPALCPLPAPAQLGLPVCHREPDVPSYTICGDPCRRSAGKRARSGRLRGPCWGWRVPVTFCLRHHRLGRYGGTAIWQRDSSLNLHLIKTETARRDQRGPVWSPSHLGPPANKWYTT